MKSECIPQREEQHLSSWYSALVTAVVAEQEECRAAPGLIGRTPFACQIKSRVGRVGGVLGQNVLPPCGRPISVAHAGDSGRGTRRTD